MSTTIANNRPRALDLYCGAGGVARGLQLAGFHVTGIDIAPQPHYVGDEFHQADALTFPLDGFDFVWASPPCQNYTTMSNRHRGRGGKADSHPDLIESTMRRLRECGAPYVLENVLGARRQMGDRSFLLHGGMFGLRVNRPRLFNASCLVLIPKASAPVNPVGVYGNHHDGRRLFDRADGSIQRAACTLEEARAAMGIDWMTWRELCEAIPPAYSKFIGEQMWEHVLHAMSTRERGAA